MREIRVRIAQRHGVDLTTQQIQDLAAHRLESILDVRSVRPELMALLRRTAGAPTQAQTETPAPPFTFDDATIYGGHRGVLGLLRRIFNPILRLLFDPDPIVDALKAQTEWNRSSLEERGAHERRQAEWNALHYEILQRMITEVSRLSLELQTLSTRVESLGAKTDFNERRVRSIEGVAFQPRSTPRSDAPQAQAVIADSPAVPPSDGSSSQSSEAPRRRRRRRRGRRAGGPDTSPEVQPGAAPETDEQDGEELDDRPDDADWALGAEAAPTAASATTDAPPDEPATPESGPPDAPDSGPIDR